MEIKMTSKRLKNVEAHGGDIPLDLFHAELGAGRDGEKGGEQEHRKNLPDDGTTAII